MSISPPSGYSAIHNTSLCRENLQQSAEIERLTRSLQEADRETARVRSLWEEARHTLNSWGYNADEVYPSGVGSAHTAGHTCQSAQRNFPVANAVSSSTFDFSLVIAGGNLVQEKQKYTAARKHLRA